MATRTAVIVGSGPNGLAAAALLARAGLSVLVFEAEAQVGGGTRTVSSTLPGFRHDHCAGVHPLGAASPLFRRLPLGEHGLEWVHPEVAAAHPLPDGTAAAVTRSVDETAAGMGSDEQAWNRVVGARARQWEAWEEIWLSPVLRVPRHPVAMVRFGPSAALPLTSLASLRFKEERARAALAGFAAHSLIPLDKPFTAAVGVMFNAAAHAVGMPLARGGSQAIADALASVIRVHGGEVVTGHRIRSMADLPPSHFTFFDLTPRQVLRIAGDRLYRRVARSFRRYRHANLIGGDIAGGYTGGLDKFLRPRVALDPYRVGDGLFICSQATPPGVGVHGMCGYWAVRSALGVESVAQALGA